MIKKKLIVSKFFLLLIFCIFVSFGAAVKADTLFDNPVNDIDKNKSLQEIVRHLGVAANVRSNFEQKKKLKILTRPMVSEGSMLYARKYGLYWHVTKPFPGTLIITDTMLLQDDGTSKNKITAQSQPTVFGFSQVFFKLLSGDISGLESHFSLYFEKQPKGWRIGLLPKKQNLKQFVQRVILEGNEHLQSVQLIDNAGDSTSIQFSSIRVDSNALTALERGYFEF